MIEPYYEADGITIYHGDCRDILPQFPDKSFDLVLTDPPYGLGFNYLSFDDTPQNVEGLLRETLPEMQRVCNRVGMAASISNLYHFPRPKWIVSAIWDTTGSYGFFGIAYYYAYQWETFWTLLVAVAQQQSRQSNSGANVP